MPCRFLALTCAVMAAASFACEAAGADRVVLVAGGTKSGEGIPAVEAQLHEPFAVDFGSAGELYIVEIAGHRVLKVDRDGLLTTIAGTGKRGNDGDGGPPLRARFNDMHNLAVGADQALYLADTGNRRVRRLDTAAAELTAFAGSGEKGFSGDGGPAQKARFGGIYCVAFDPAQKNLYLADLDNRRIRRVELASGVVTTAAGNGQSGTPEDGATAADAPLVDPRAVAVDRTGNIYILERGGHALRRVDPQGKIRTVAGTGKAGAAGEGGDALAAQLNGSKHLCIDQDENVLIADTENHVIRKFLPKKGTIVRVAGTGKKGNAGLGGPALEIELARPHGVHVDRQGAIYIADSGNNRVLKILP